MIKAALCFLNLVPLFVQQLFETYIRSNQFFTKRTKLILALSGGIDSVVLAYLLKEGGFTFSMAHANFKLRGKDSEADEAFCKQLAKKLKVPIFTKTLSIKAYQAMHPSGIQEAARNLRYNWFNELLVQTKSAYILTAHHANDMIETVLLNMLRGTGINGLKGIPEKNGNIIRPLLHFEKEEIVGYAKAKGIEYRTDKSNLEDKYKRNFIRLNIIPQLKELQPKLEQIFISNSNHLREESAIVKEYLTMKAEEYCTQTKDSLFIHKKKLQKEKYLKSFLHFMMTKFGFTASQENSVLKNIQLNATSGKYFYSSTHQLFIDRSDLVIKPLKQNKEIKITVHSLSELESSDLFTLKKVKKFTVPKKNEIYLNSAQLIFPLLVRSKQTGDKFKPFGMKGFKLLSDFIKSEKLDLSQKENCKVLVNGNSEIIWVIGHRSDERYKVDASEKQFIKLSYHE